MSPNMQNKAILTFLLNALKPNALSSKNNGLRKVGKSECKFCEKVKLRVNMRELE